MKKWYKARMYKLMAIHAYVYVGLMFATAIATGVFLGLAVVSTR